MYPVDGDVTACAGQSTIYLETGVGAAEDDLLWNPAPVDGGWGL